MQAFLLLIANLFLYGTMAVGVAVVSAYLYAYLRSALCPCDERRSTILASVLTAGLILFSLWLLPQVWVMDIPLLNILPMLIYVVYAGAGLVHLCMWRWLLLRALTERTKWITCRCRGECGCQQPASVEPCTCPATADCGCGRRDAAQPGSGS
ncbi:MAG: hypothetical protein K2W95_15995 [Candidatus Obscuribacterales bacterium]|nr:hypothetical protein [Candidatus Obscuribacterales bacterium]